MKKDFLVLGITGGIASGKSTVAQELEAAGIPVLDADKLARELSTEGGLAAPAILARFGTLDRAVLRERIFKDLQDKKDLEGILHPVIQQESMRRLKELSKSSQVHSSQNIPWVAYEAILLLEAGRKGDLDHILLVEASDSIRKQRLLKRDAIASSLADSILKSQNSDTQRRKLSDGHPTTILLNEADADSVKMQIRNLVLELQN